MKRAVVCTICICIEWLINGNVHIQGGVGDFRKGFNRFVMQDSLVIKAQNPDFNSHGSTKILTFNIPWFLCIPNSDFTCTVKPTHVVTSIKQSPVIEIFI